MSPDGPRDAGAAGAPNWFESITNIEDFIAANLPEAEDGEHEYKSSRTPAQALADKLGTAASAFWNSGGGRFIAGVDGTGKPDGGLAIRIGRQAIRDWADQAIAKVHPHGPYHIKTIQWTDNDGATRCLLMVAFTESGEAPHMSPDGRYLIRAGAHSVPASAFVVEALWARRQLSRPLLRHVLRVNPQTGRTLQLGIVAASASSALNVALVLPALPLIGREPKTYQIGLVSQNAPVYFDFDFLDMRKSAGQRFEAHVHYEDAARRQYRDVFQVDTDSQMGPPAFDHRPDLIRDALRDIAGSMASIAHRLEQSANRRH